MESKLCPKCGAYWSCECVIEAPAPEPVWPARQEIAPTEMEQPKIMQAAGCQHDWTEVVGVELDEEADFGEAQVLVCRFCGLYAVEKKSA